MFEKYPKGQKDFSTILQKARASGAEALVPTSYEGDLISMTRQMKQLDINFPYVFMVYASTPQFQAIGADADYIYSHTNYHPAINWKVNAGLTREQFATSYDRLFPRPSSRPISRPRWPRRGRADRRDRQAGATTPPRARRPRWTCPASSR